MNWITMDDAAKKHIHNPWYLTWIMYGLIPLVLGSCTLLLPDRARWHPPGIKEGYVTLATVRTWESAPYWIDARSQEDYESETIPGAHWMDASEFESQLMGLMERWMPGMQIVVFCSSAACDSSHDVAERLRNEAGLPSVWVLQGGWESWKRENR